MFDRRTIIKAMPLVGLTAVLPKTASASFTPGRVMTLPDGKLAVTPTDADTVPTVSPHDGVYRSGNFYGFGDFYLVKDNDQQQLIEHYLQVYVFDDELADFGFTTSYTLPYAGTEENPVRIDWVGGSKEGARSWTQLTEKGHELAGGWDALYEQAIKAYDAVEHPDGLKFGVYLPYEANMLSTGVVPRTAGPFLKDSKWVSYNKWNDEPGWHLTISDEVATSPDGYPLASEQGLVATLPTLHVFNL